MSAAPHLPALDRLLVGLCQRRLDASIAADPVDAALLHIDLQRQQLRRWENCRDDFRVSLSLISGFAERHVAFGDVPVEQAAVRELDRLTARVIELEAQLRRGHLRVVS